MSETEYREHPDYPGYRFGDDGSFWTCRRRGNDGSGRRFGGWLLTDQWVRRKPVRQANGYFHMALRRRDGHWHQRGAHALILEAFVGPRPPGMQCRHLDGDPGNNCLPNLCWGTPAENAADRDRHGRTARGDASSSRRHPERRPRGQRHGMAKLTDESVRRIRELAASGVRDGVIAAQFGISPSNVRWIRTGKHWAHVI